MRRKAAIGYLLLVHLALALAVARPAMFLRGLGLSEPFGERLHEYNLSVDATAPDGVAVFLGDSITRRLSVAAVEPRSINLGIGSQSVGELVERVPQYHSLPRASVIYLLIGTKDLQSGMPDYAALAALLPPNVPLVWSGVMPSVKVPPERLRAANAQIRALCEARPNCRFVDTSFMQPQDFVDGVHPNADGYRKWIAALQAQ